MNPVLRMLKRIDGNINHAIERHLTVAGIPLSTGYAPRLAAGHTDTNPRQALHCTCCRTSFAPADCPLTHLDCCPTCTPSGAA